ncbi:MAG TPA: L-histidine N(alpha)-methyltransferase [Longimicrobium sp.]
MTRVAREAAHGRVVLYDLEPVPDDLRADVLAGLTGPVKKLSPKYFYDEAGARLFERICELGAYYPTRTEIGILRRAAGEIARCIGPGCRLVEFGSGSGIKTRILLEELREVAAYLPIDISRAQLLAFAISVAEAFPELEVLPVCADYTSTFSLPEPTRPAAGVVAFFPGSTIGNFEPDDAARFLERVGELCGPGGRLLIGVDLAKDPEVIERAYNDPEGVTAAFNLNLLARINRECGADFDLAAFRHHAPYVQADGRVEMHLVSTRAQEVRIPAAEGPHHTRIAFRPGESILTEYSHKYAPGAFERLAHRAGWVLEQRWTDDREWFAVYLLRRA